MHISKIQALALRIPGLNPKLAPLPLFGPKTSVSAERMASATGIPQAHPDTIVSQETAPLLGRPGDVTQKQDESIARNLISGELETPEAF